MGIKEDIVKTINYINDNMFCKAYYKNTVALLNGNSCIDGANGCDLFGEYPQLKPFNARRYFDELIDDGIIKPMVGNKGPGNPCYVVCKNMHVQNAISDKFLSRMGNKEDSFEFEQEDFEDVGWDNDDMPPDSKIVSKMKCFNKTFYLMSSSEEKFLNYIVKNKIAKDCGMNLLLSYDTHAASGKNYYLDFVLYTIENKIALVEIKDTAAISYHINMSKYKALKEYAEDNGYEYMLYDPEEDITYEELFVDFIDSGLKDSFYSWFYDDSNAHFDKEDVDEWFKDRDNFDMTKKEFNKQVHGLIMYHDLYNVAKHGFNVYKTYEDSF